MGVLTTLINQHRGHYHNNQQSHDDDNDNVSSSHYNTNNNNFSNCQSDNTSSSDVATNKNKMKQKNCRNGSNSAFVSLLAVAVTILCVFITKCDANNSANINNNNAQLTANLLDVKPVNYSVWNQNVTYLSSSAHNARGMGPLYNISNIIINLFVDDEEPIPRGKCVVILLMND